MPITYHDKTDGRKREFIFRSIPGLFCLLLQKLCGCLQKHRVILYLRESADNTNQRFILSDATLFSQCALTILKFRRIKSEWNHLKFLCLFDTKNIGNLAALLLTDSNDFICTKSSQQAFNQDKHLGFGFAV